MDIRTNVRRRIYKDQDLGELARDVDDSLKELVPTRIVKLTDVYAEPFRVKLASEPEGILAIRVREDADPETEVATLPALPFVFRNGSAEITAVEGCTVGTRYRFTLMVVG